MGGVGAQTTCDITGAGRIGDLFRAFSSRDSLSPESMVELSCDFWKDRKAL